MNLKDPVLAAFLAWLVPGAGHFYQGRYAKGVLFSVCILGTFLYGLYLGGGRCVYLQFQPASMRRYSYVCQVGAGLPALPAVAGWIRRENGNAAKNPDAKLPLLPQEWYMPPVVDFPQGADKATSPQLDGWYKKYHRFFELGTVFTMVAGLLNILAIYDAWGGPAFPAPTRKEESSPSDSLVG